MRLRCVPIIHYHLRALVKVLSIMKVSMTQKDRPAKPAGLSGLAFVKPSSMLLYSLALK